jgi:hypothetical protein
MEELLGGTTLISALAGKPPTLTIYPASGFATLPLSIR